MEHYATAPQDRIPFPKKVIYGFGAFVNNMLADAIGRMVIVLNLGLGMNPALAGLVAALPRLTDALTDPAMGFISDKTRSRWGRRRPYIFVGAIAAGITFALIWQTPIGKTEMYYFGYFLAGFFLFYLAYTVFVTPWIALGYELTPDYHERTRLMGVQNIIGTSAYMITPYLLAIMTSKRLFENQVDGAAGLAIVIGVVAIVLGVLPAIFLRERFADDGDSGISSFTDGVRQFLKGFLITLKFKPFLKLCVATFLVFNGFILIAAFQSYVIIYFVFAGDADAGADWVGHTGLLQTVSGLVAIVMDNPWLVLLPAPFLAFGLAGLFTLMSSMVADVVDFDELNTGERREGMYGSIFWWVVKLGQSVAIAGGGFLLNITGFDVSLGGEQTEEALTLMRLCDAFIPVAASAIAIWAVASYSITEEKAHEIRMLLEERRGK
jgi:GPH family glycoside/pentoside/hexuronide:cation symporter